MTQKTVKKKDFLSSKRMLEEAGIKHKRANDLIGFEDYSGAVEASQHSVELAIKSLFVLFGRKWPKTHNPGKNLGEIIETFENMDTSINSAIEEGVTAITDTLTRLKFLSQSMERLHIVGMYGFDGVPASKLFRKRDAEYYSWISAETLFVIRILSIIIAAGLGFLSESEKKQLVDFFDFWTKLQSFFTSPDSIQ